MGHPREEVEEAFAEFIRRGVENRDWPAWAALSPTTPSTSSTTSALPGPARDPRLDRGRHGPVPEHDLLGRLARHRGRPGGLLHLEPPAGPGRRRHLLLVPQHQPDRLRGRREWSREEDFYNPADANRAVGHWYRAGGSKATPRNDDLVAPEDWAPLPRPRARPHRGRGRLPPLRRAGPPGRGVRRLGDLGQAVRRGRPLLRAPLRPLQRPGRDQGLDRRGHAALPRDGLPDPLDGSTATGASSSPNRLPDPTGGDTPYEFPACVVLHYAGDDHGPTRRTATTPTRPPRSSWLARRRRTSCPKASSSPSSSPVPIGGADRPAVRVHDLPAVLPTAAA